MELISSPSADFSPASTEAEGRGRTWWATILAVVFFWLIILNQQRLEWSVNPVYSYGWAVPLLAGYLFWSRWQDRPATGSRLGWGWFVGGVSILLLCYLPVRVIQEANPDWVKINWIMASLWVGLAFLALGRLGGASQVWHFIFPFLFCFTALPWPVWMEESLAQNLMRLNAEVSAEFLTLIGIPAMAKGNLIQVADRWVNVEEACSGIRSLQTAFMMSLFLGEFYRMNLWRRAALLFSSFAVAFLVNLIRTVILTNFAKTDSIAKWHDTVGTISMVVCLAALWGLAEWIQASKKSRQKTTDVPVVMAGNEGMRVSPPFSWTGAGLMCAWLGVAEVLTLKWYRNHEAALPPPLVWNLNLPRQAPEFAEGTFADRMQALLKFNAGTTASWNTADGYQWQMYYLQWQPGRVSKFLSSSHYPTVCLPASGMRLVSETGVWNCRINGVDIPFTTYLFDEGGRDVYVFHAIVEDRPSVGGTRLSYRQVSSNERIDSVKRGERNLGQHVVGIAVRGPMAPSEARAVVSDTLVSVVSITSPTGGFKTAALP
jgi:exosortase